MSRVSCRQTPRLLSLHLPIPHPRIHHPSRSRPIRLNRLHLRRTHCHLSRLLLDHFQRGQSRPLRSMVLPCD